MWEKERRKRLGNEEEVREREAKEVGKRGHETEKVGGRGTLREEIERGRGGKRVRRGTQKKFFGKGN